MNVCATSCTPVLGAITTGICDLGHPIPCLSSNICFVGWKTAPKVRLWRGRRVFDHLDAATCSATDRKDVKTLLEDSPNATPDTDALSRSGNATPAPPKLTKMSEFDRSIDFLKVLYRGATRRCGRPAPDRPVRGGSARQGAPDGA